MTPTARNRYAAILSGQFVACVIVCSVLASDPPSLPESIPSEISAKLKAASERDAAALGVLKKAFDKFEKDFKDYDAKRSLRDKAAAKVLEEFDKLKKADTASPNQATKEALFDLILQAEQVNKSGVAGAEATAKTSWRELIEARSNVRAIVDAYSAALKELDKMASPAEAGDGEASVAAETSSSFALADPPAQKPLVPASAPSSKPLQNTPPAPLMEKPGDEGSDVVRPLDAFPFGLPRVSVVSTSEGLAKSVANDGPLVGEDVREYRFDSAARFALPGFGGNCEILDRTGVIIYEGMRFAVRPDGHYQVRFTMTAPAIPVTLKLQLTVMDDLGSVYTVTLPPITYPRKDEPKHEAVQAQIDPVYVTTGIVTHEGALSSFRSDLSVITKVERRGIARFGFGVDVP